MTTSSRTSGRSEHTTGWTIRRMLATIAAMMRRVSVSDDDFALAATGCRALADTLSRGRETLTDPHATNLEQAFRVAAMAKKLGLKIRNSSEEYVASLSRDELDQLTKESRLIESCKSREERRAAIEASPAFRRATESIRVRIVRGQLLVEEFDSMDTTAYHASPAVRAVTLSD